jgi:acetoin utilization deacetylase AcuC-like enzyme
LLRDYLQEHKEIHPSQHCQSPLASQEIVELAHDPAYVESLRTGHVDEKNFKRIGFPWSQELFFRSLATVGGALQSALSALDDKVAGNLAGGTHHAHFDRGEGYCVFNDLAVVCKYFLKHRLVNRIAIVDLDVHQGNGNSSILSSENRVFVASLHCEKNYPFKKVPSTLDIGLTVGATDKEYLAGVDQILSAVSYFHPDLILYQMGVDPLEFDRLGQLKVSFEGLKARDEKVFDFAFSNDIPISLALGGGYSDPIELSVEAYANTYRALNQARSFFL